MKQTKRDEHSTKNTGRGKKKKELPIERENRFTLTKPQSAQRNDEALPRSAKICECKKKKRNVVVRDDKRGRLLTLARET